MVGIYTENKALAYFIGQCRLYGEPYRDVLASFNEEV
jgi:hypothetical protein